MKEVGFLLLGWTLGLIGPPIVEKIKSYFRRREVAAALRVELEDLQFRLATTSLLFIISYGNLDKKFLNWVQPILENYAGDEPNDGQLKFIKESSTLDDSQINQIAQRTRKLNVGSSVKLFQAKFLESQLTEIAKMPVKTQRRIHEFRNQLDVLNQEIAKIDGFMKMTFDDSLSEQNSKIVRDEIQNKYRFVQERSKICADKIAAVLEAL
jgi:hypothetical protein